MSNSMTYSNVQGRRQSDDDEGEERMPPMRQTLVVRPEPFVTFEATRQQCITSFYISDAIGDPQQYAGMIHRIRTAPPQDIIYMHMNTTGGRLDTGVQIINAMKDSEARIVAVLDSKAYSLGTLLFLAADEFVIHENCMFMIHNYSGGVAGKGNEQASELEATMKWFKKLAKKYYIPFLSKKELKAVLNGKDMWMDSDEIKKRLRNMVKIQLEQAEANEAISKAKSSEVLVDGVLPESPNEVQVPTQPVTAVPAPRKRAPRRRKSDKTTDVEIEVEVVEKPTKPAPKSKPKK